MDLLKRYKWTWLLLFVFVVAAAGLTYTALGLGKSKLPELGEVGDFTMENVSGEQVSRDDTKGKVRLMYFYFTSCPDVCPVTTFLLSQIQNELKEARSEIDSLKSEAAKSAMGDVTDNIREIAGVKFIASKMEGVDANGLRELGDSLKDKIGEGVIVLASVTDGKVQLMATATDGVMKKGAHAGNLIKGIAKLVGGGGGGRPNMAMAGGKDASGVDAALAEAEKVLEQQLG